MEKCLLDGRIIYAMDVSNGYIDETEIREKSRERQLLCFDPECGQTVIFKRGEKRSAHFAHLPDHRQCDYDDYDRDTPDTWKEVKRNIYNHFKGNFNAGLSVDMDVKIFPKHFTPILLKQSNNQQIVIEFGDKKTTSKTLTALTNAYRKRNIEVEWVTVDDVGQCRHEQDFYYIKRFQLNESKTHSAIVVDKGTQQFVIYALDQDAYKYKGADVIGISDQNIFSFQFPLNNLIFENKNLSEIGFGQSFKDWKTQKTVALEGFIKQDELRRQARKQREEEIKRLKQERQQEGNIQRPKRKLVHIEQEEPLEPFCLQKISIPRTYYPVTAKLHPAWTEKDFADKLKSAVHENVSAVKMLISKVYECDDAELAIFLQLYERAKTKERTPEIRRYLAVFEHVLEQAKKIES